MLVCIGKSCALGLVYHLKPVAKTLGIVFPNIDLLSGEYHIFIHITCIIDIVWML